MSKFDCPLYLKDLGTALKYRNNWIESIKIADKLKEERDTSIKKLIKNLKIFMKKCGTKKGGKKK